jgi:hypothetical protein
MNPTKSSNPNTGFDNNRAWKNALKHGLTARRWLSQAELDSYSTIFKDLCEEYQPETATERLLIESISVTMTKIRRLTEVEDAKYRLVKSTANTYAFKGLLSQISKDANGTDVLSPDDIRRIYIGAAMPDPQIMSTINRQQNSLSRQLSKELGELMTLINLRKNGQAQEVPTNRQTLLETESG